MYRLLIFSLFIGFLFIHCEEKATTPETKADIDLGSFEITEVKGGVQRAVKYGNGDALMERGYLVDDEMSGTWVTYREDGRISKLTSYAKGERNGPYMEFSRRGQIEYIANYEDDMLNGKAASYRNGRRLEVARYKDGKLHGTRELYFDSGRDMGKLQRTIEYKNGVIDGKMRYYNSEGKVTLEYTYENGERVGGGMKKNSNGTGDQ